MFSQTGIILLFTWGVLGMGVHGKGLCVVGGVHDRRESCMA